MKLHLPIKKVVVGLVAAGLTYASVRLGLGFGSTAINEAAPAVVGYVVSYVVRDPQVKAFVDAETDLDTP